MPLTELYFSLSKPSVLGNHKITHKPCIPPRTGKDDIVAASYKFFSLTIHNLNNI